MNYQIPQDIDKNKIFIIHRSEIEGRLDPYYNKPIYSDIWKILSSISAKLSSLKKHSICITSGITPKSGSDAYVTSDGIPFVRSGDFSEANEIDFSSLLLLKKDVHDGIMRSSQLKKGDLLIAIVGATIGKIGVYQYEAEANINQAICAVRFDKTLNPYYVQAFYQTSIGQQILNRIKRPVARANINLEEVGNLPIPLLDIFEQKKIVKVMDDARSFKRKKELESKQLERDMSDYILHNLGISLQTTNIIREEKDKCLDKTNNVVKSGKLFLTSFKEIVGRRFDPVNILYLGQKAQSTIYADVPLKEIATLVKGQTITEETAIKGDYSVIAGGQTSPYMHNTYNQEGNVITVSASGAYSGFVWYHTTPIFASDCTVIRSKDEKRFRTQYIFEVLKAQQEYIYLLQQGSGQPHVYPTDLAQLWIPDITIEKQDELIQTVQAMRDKATQLRQEGIECLENAKREIEKQIIG